MKNVIDINTNKPHEVAELICIKCYHRYIGVYPQAILLKDLECENCGKGFIIKTGQITNIKALEQEQMRSATPEEQESVNDYIKSISKDTGVSFWDSDQEPCEDVIAIHTQGLDESIRCAMCTNSFKSNRGCDGGCVVNEDMYKEVMNTIRNHIASSVTPQQKVRKYENRFRLCFKKFR